MKLWMAEPSFSRGLRTQRGMINCPSLLEAPAAAAERGHCVKRVAGLDTLDGS